MPSDMCLVCDKNVIVRNRKKEFLVKCVTSIRSTAETKNDESIILKIRDMDLVAREAHYHSTCRRDYTRSSGSHGASINEQGQTALEAAHRVAFEHVRDYVNEYVILGLNVVRLTMLRERYLQYMIENSPAFCKAEYKTYKLKDKLIVHFGHSLQFWQPN